MSQSKRTVIQWIVFSISMILVIGGTAAAFIWLNAQKPAPKTAEVTEQLEPANALLLLAEPMTGSGSVELPEGQSLVIAEKGDNLNYLSGAWKLSDVTSGLTVVTTEAQRAKGEPFVLEAEGNGTYGFTLLNEGQNRAYQITVTRDSPIPVPTETPDAG